MYVYTNTAQAKAVTLKALTNVKIKWPDIPVGTVKAIHI